MKMKCHKVCICLNLLDNVKQFLHSHKSEMKVAFAGNAYDRILDFTVFLFQSFC